MTASGPRQRPNGAGDVSQDGPEAHKGAQPRNPRVGLDADGTLDEFLATGVEAVHFEAMDEAEWWASVRLRNGEEWHLNFGARNPRARGYARAERVQ